MKQYKTNILFICTVLLLFTACKSGKYISIKDKKGTDTASELKEMTPSQAVIAIQKNQAAFNRAYAKKMSISIDAFDRQMDVKATCKIVTDSAIHISVMPFFGVELFKLEMTPVSMTLIDKANRRYYQSNYGIFYTKLGVNINYNTIQSLISNRLFIPGNKLFLPEDFKWKNDTLPNTLATRFDKIEEEVTIDFTLERIVELFIKSIDSKVSMKTNYSDFKTFNSHIFPEKIKMTILTETQRNVFSFKLEEVEFNKPFRLTNTNIMRYKQGDIRSFFRK